MVIKETEQASWKIERESKRKEREEKQEEFEKRIRQELQRVVKWRESKLNIVVVQNNDKP